MRSLTRSQHAEGGRPHRRRHPVGANPRSAQQPQRGGRVGVGGGAGADLRAAGAGRRWGGSAEGEGRRAREAGVRYYEFANNRPL